MSWSPPPFLKAAIDLEEVQATILRSAIGGNTVCLARLSGLAPAFSEPYQTIAYELLRLHEQYGVVDNNILGSALKGRPLCRTRSDGRKEELSTDQAVALLGGEPVPPEKATAYLDILSKEIEHRRRQEWESRVKGLVTQHLGDPSTLLSELQRTVAANPSSGSDKANRYPPELLELIPYARHLEEYQKGQPFQGLNSGFEHINYLCNGLDVGLFVLAAKPGEGKTTLVFQICCQAAQINKIPVIFVSFEQSKWELRAKALARLGRLEYRHVLRGRLHADDPDHRAKLFCALDRYSLLAPYLTIVEADDTTTVDVIGEIAQLKMERAKATHCLLAVDYLQIIPLAERDAGRVTNTKDRVDLHVSALRRLARDLNACVLSISSENRAGYKSKTLDVFKESGGIEYSSDVAAVLTGDETHPAAEGICRVENLNIIKNRNGERGVVKFQFYANRAEFVETGRKELAQEEAD